ncbi:MAG: rod shape-determining protein [Oscillospiraceae bacterium]|nr:rod shape-determining protein [Oscillospiraceae bacterium]
MLLAERDIAIDMGTSTTLVFEQGKGIVLREPTVVAVDKFTGKILKVGQDAQKMLGRTPANIVAIHPISAGVISDYEMTAQMQRDLISRITSFSFFKPCVLACVPSSISGVEERAVIDAAIEAGARKVYLLETAVATALGAGVDISKADGHMVIDIGGGTTEIAIISVGGVVECESIKVAGASFDEAIVKFIRRKHNMLIGLGAAEELKRSIGGVMQRPDVGIEEVKGRSLTNGLPKTVNVSSNELIEAFVEPMNQILDAIHNVLERTPPQLVGDLDKNGIIMSGGGSLIYGIDRLIERSTGMRTNVVDDPISCAAYGAGKMLKRLDEMQDGMMNFYRKRQLKN